MEYAHFPQYLAFVVLGITAANSNWIYHIPKSVGNSWLFIGVLLIALNVIGFVPHSGVDGIVVHLFMQSMRPFYVQDFQLV